MRACGVLRVALTLVAKVYTSAVYETREFKDRSSWSLRACLGLGYPRCAGVSSRCRSQCNAKPLPNINFTQDGTEPLESYGF
ncbi:unnamed protein product [Danaus chrysippus]|uniref:(African queen) hypothetical protein n=1 Tax=Danaus chrysippus TaxID=151541 RepID=A0A8J2W188_9NEOP|nr:unnamed protein product [Danaus chrysippus]